MDKLERVRRCIAGEHLDRPPFRYVDALSYERQKPGYFGRCLSGTSRHV